MGARGADPRPAQGDRGRRAEVPAPRREGQGPLHDRPDERPPAQGDDPGARAFEDDDGEQWLLITEARRDASAGWDAEDHPQSVKTGRTNDEVKADRDALWIEPGARRRRPRSTSPARSRRRCPQHIEPMLATLASKPFSDPDWLFEIKWDGYRRPGRRRRRQGQDSGPATSRTPRPTSRGSCRRRPGSTPSRPSSMARSWRSTRTAARTSRCSRRKLGDKAGVGGLVYQAFDLLYLDGRSLLDVPLEDRKRLLRSVLKRASAGPVRGARRGRGRGVLRGRGGQRARGHRRQAPPLRYEPGRRTKRLAEVQDPAGAGARGRRLDAGRGERPGPRGARGRRTTRTASCRFGGKVGSGFTGAIRKELLAALKPLATDDPPFDPPPPKDYRGRWGGDLGEITWVRPELVIRAELGGWTRDGIVRQTAFKGIEPGRDPTDRRRARTRSPRPARSVPPRRPSARGPSGIRARSTRCRRPRKTTRSRRRRARSKAPADAADVPAAWRVTDDELAALDALGKEGVWRVGERRAQADEPRQDRCSSRASPTAAARSRSAS